MWANPVQFGTNIAPGVRQHGLSVTGILDWTTDVELSELIRGVGFHNNKTKFIRQATQVSFTGSLAQCFDRGSLSEA